MQLVSKNQEIYYDFSSSAHSYAFLRIQELLEKWHFYWNWIFICIWRFDPGIGRATLKWVAVHTVAFCYTNILGMCSCYLLVRSELAIGTCYFICRDNCWSHNFISGNRPFLKLNENLKKTVIFITDNDDDSKSRWKMRVTIVTRHSR